MRKNMKIPRKKEKQYNELLYWESQDYQLSLNPLRSNQVEEMEVMIKKSVCKKMWKKTYEWKNCKI